MNCEGLHAILHLVLQAGNIMNAVSPQVFVSLHALHCVHIHSSKIVLQVLYLLKCFCPFLVSISPLLSI